MAKFHGRLTQKKAESFYLKPRLKPGQRSRREYDGPNLALQITAGAQRPSLSWIYHYVSGGKARDLGLGPLHVVNVAEARKRAIAASLMRLDGVDPLERKRERRAATLHTIPFAEASRRYIKAHQSEWSNNEHRAQWTATLETYAFPALGKMLVRHIQTPDVLRVLEPIWQSKHITATRLRGRIESVLDWAKSHGYRSGENAAAWKGNLENLLPGVARDKKQPVHHPAVPFDELPAFIAKLRQVDEFDAGAALFIELLTLTAVRLGELRHATREEFDLANATWTIPPARTKTGAQHRVALSPRAVAIIESLPGSDSALLFPSPVKPDKPISGTPLRKLLHRLAGSGVTLHGLRSGFSSWAHTRGSFPFAHVETALGHLVGSDVHRAYQRDDYLEPRRRLMGKWAEFLLAPKAAASVTPLRRKGGGR